MGYAHYWNYSPKKKSSVDSKKTILNEIDIMLKNLPDHSKSGGGYYDDLIELKGGMGTGDPEFTEKLISFNGDKSKDLGHETFHFEFGQPIDFKFCKTARKPYDFMACLCLLSLANNLDGFKFSSDGDMDDWKPTIDFYEKHIGKLKPEIKKFI